MRFFHTIARAAGYMARGSLREFGNPPFIAPPTPADVKALIRNTPLDVLVAKKSVLAHLFSLRAPDAEEKPLVELPLGINPLLRKMGDYSNSGQLTVSVDTTASGKGDVYSMTVGQFAALINDAVAEQSFISLPMQISTTDLFVRNLILDTRPATDTSPSAANTLWFKAGQPCGSMINVFASGILSGPLFKAYSRHIREAISISLGNATNSIERADILFAGVRFELMYGNPGLTALAFDTLSAHLSAEIFVGNPKSSAESLWRRRLHAIGQQVDADRYLLTGSVGEKAVVENFLLRM